eukprot:2335829-Rhodomonas_salina.1
MPCVSGTDLCAVRTDIGYAATRSERGAGEAEGGVAPPYGPTPVLRDVRRGGSQAEDGVYWVVSSLRGSCSGYAPTPSTLP